eukprot:TRINITY_DN15104_c0_g1_i1.p1 TRINITY_DN15104_c0_g1~~TRINITY_DN15104_c0_g1_i1.p1  ORF type:complete len:920 (+),score=220.91 TRINITY_DN15104_c0_g1_i1:204-2963(+)
MAVTMYEREAYTQEITNLLMQLGPLSGIQSLENPETARAKASDRERNAFDETGGNRPAYINKIRADIQTLKEKLAAAQQAHQLRQAGVNPAATAPGMMHQKPLSQPGQMHPGMAQQQMQTQQQQQPPRIVAQPQQMYSQQQPRPQQPTQQTAYYPGQQGAMMPGGAPPGPGGVPKAPVIRQMAPQQQIPAQLAGLPLAQQQQQAAQPQYVVAAPNPANPKLMAQPNLQQRGASVPLISTPQTHLQQQQQQQHLQHLQQQQQQQQALLQQQRQAAAPPANPKAPGTQYSYAAAQPQQPVAYVQQQPPRAAGPPSAIPGQPQQPQRPLTVEETRKKYEELRTTLWPQLEATAKKAMQFKQEPPQTASPDVLSLLGRLITAYNHVTQPFPAVPDLGYMEDIQRTYDVVVKQRKAPPAGGSAQTPQPGIPGALPVSVQMTPQQQQQQQVQNQMRQMQPVTVAVSQQTPPPISAATANAIVIDDTPDASVRGSLLATNAGAKMTAAAAAAAGARIQQQPGAKMTAAAPPNSTVTVTATPANVAATAASAAAPGAAAAAPRRPAEEVTLPDATNELLKEVEKGLPEAVIAVLRSDVQQATRGRLTPELVKSFFPHLKDSNNLFWWEPRSTKSSSTPSGSAGKKRSASEMLSGSQSPSGSESSSVVAHVSQMMDSDVIQARTVNPYDLAPAAKRQKMSGFSAFDLLDSAKEAISKSCEADAVLKPLQYLDDSTVMVEYGVPSSVGGGIAPPRLIISFRQPDDAVPVLVDPENPSLAQLAPTFTVDNVEYPNIFHSAAKKRVDSLHKLKKSPSEICLEIVSLWKSYIQALSTVANIMRQPPFSNIRLSETLFNQEHVLLCEYPGIPSLHVGIPVDYPKSPIKIVHINMPPNYTPLDKQKRDNLMTALKTGFPHPLEKILSLWINSFS